MLPSESEINFFTHRFCNVKFAIAIFAPKSGRLEVKMAFAGMCPYLKDARSCERTICECARFTFPDKISRRDILYKYCGHPTGWKKCMFKAVMDGYYDRKYSVNDAADPENARGKSASKSIKPSRGHK